MPLNINYIKLIGQRRELIKAIEERADAIHSSSYTPVGGGDAYRHINTAKEIVVLLEELNALDQQFNQKIP